MAVNKIDKAAAKKLMDAAINKLKKQYGDNVILDSTRETSYETISSGSLIFDQATGIGGIPRGRLVEIFGENSVGKSSWCFSLVAQAQKKYPNEKVLFVDIEQAGDLNYMRKFGIDTNNENFIFTQPDSAEEGLTIVETFVDTGLFSLVIYDSIGASLTLDQQEKGIDEHTMGSLAKKMSVGGNKIKNSAAKNNTAVVFVNQVYDKMSYMGGVETKGGKAMKFYASMRIELRKRDLMTSDSNKETIIGQALAFKFIKNKVGQPYQKGEAILYFGKGFDQYSEIVELATQYGLINKGGAWFSFKAVTGEDLKFQGKERVIDYFKNSDQDFDYYQTKVREIFNKNTETLTAEEILQIENEEKSISKEVLEELVDEV